MSKDKAPEFDCVAICVTKNSDRFGGYIKHRLRLTEADLKRLAVESTEPEIVGVVAGMMERDLFRWVDR